MESRNSAGAMPAAYVSESLKEICRVCNISVFFTPLDDTARKITADPALAEYACSLYREFSESESWNSFAGHYMPSDKLGSSANLIFLLTALSGIPAALERYRKQGTPEELIAKTLDFFRPDLLHFAPEQLSFHRNFYYAILYRIGRFQFKLHKDKRDLPAILINRKEPSRKILIASDQTLCDERGFIARENARWIARTGITDRWIRGHVVLADGTVARTEETFPFDEWRMQYGARTVIDMHIPAGGGMTPELSRESLKKALQFFAGQGDVVYCGSWILNPDLRGLPGTKNITALMEMGHLFPVQSNGKDGLFFLFGRETDNISELPRDTTLQRSVLDYMKRGGKLRSGGIFFFNDEL